MKDNLGVIPVACIIVEAALLKLSGMKYIPTMLSTFSITRKNKAYDVTPFLKFMLRACIDSLNEITQKITYYIRKFTLRDYYDSLTRHRKLIRRQNELLLSLLEEDERYSFTLHDLFTTPPFRSLYRDVSERTARRDLKKLHQSRLLHVNQAHYFLNWRVLDAIYRCSDN